MTWIYRDRYEAGAQLAAALAGRPDAGRVLVVALSPAGVAVASEVAGALGAPFTLWSGNDLVANGRERSVQGRPVILVDDGLDAAHDVREAIHRLREAGPEALIVAVPVADPAALLDVGLDADEVICLNAPRNFAGTRNCYEHSPEPGLELLAGLLAGGRASGFASTGSKHSAAVDAHHQLVTRPQRALAGPERSRERAPDSP